jgi:hypothetical protein
MDPYLSHVKKPFHLDPRNLFALRADLHNVFDSASFAIVPKRGVLYTHFLQYCDQAGQGYQDVTFDHAGMLSIELLYARFAWSIMKIMGEIGLDPERFDFVKCSIPKGKEKLSVQHTAEKGDGGDGDGGGGDGSGGEGSDGGGRGGGGDKDDDGGGVRKHRGTKNTLYIYLTRSHHIEIAESRQDRDARELAEDNEKAARVIPFFGMSLSHMSIIVIFTRCTS